MKADNQVFLFSVLMLALGLGGMQAALADDVITLRPLPIEHHEPTTLQEVDPPLHVYIKPALPHPPPSTPTHGGSDLQKQGVKPPLTPTNPGDPRLEAKPWLGEQEPQAKGIKIPDPKAGDRTDPNAPRHTVPSPKNGNDKPVKADVSPGGFGTGMNTGSGPNVGVGMTPDMKLPVMSPVPSLPNPMSGNGGPSVTPMDGYHP